MWLLLKSEGKIVPRKDILISFLLLPFYNTFLSITPLDYYFDRHFGEGDIHCTET